MSNKISRRAFLKVTGVSALALGAASMLGGCQSSSGSVEVKVGDKVSNWNNLGVQLSSVFTLSQSMCSSLATAAMVSLRQRRPT